MPSDPLEQLLLDSDEVDRSRLAKGLKDILGVDTESGKVVIKPRFNKLVSSHKVLAYLLGAKAAYLLGKADFASTPLKTIVTDTGIPRGTVAPKIRDLLSRRLISQDDSGEYYVASHQLQQAITHIGQEDKNG